MKTSLRILVVIFLASFLMACGKDERPPSASGDKDNMFRDWTKKGKRTPAPPPQDVFKKK